MLSVPWRRHGLGCLSYAHCYGVTVNTAFTMGNDSGHVKGMAHQANSMTGANGFVAWFFVDNPSHYCTFVISSALRSAWIYSAFILQGRLFILHLFCKSPLWCLAWARVADAFRAP